VDGLEPKKEAMRMPLRFFPVSQLDKRSRERETTFPLTARPLLLTQKKLTWSYAVKKRGFYHRSAHEDARDKNILRVLSAEIRGLDSKEEGCKQRGEARGLQFLEMRRLQMLYKEQVESTKFSDLPDDWSALSASRESVI